MNYSKRDELQRTAREALPKVLEAGAALGYWEVLPAKVDGDGNTRTDWRTVRTPAGYLFDLSVGGWGHEGTIHAQLATIEGVGRKRVHVSDVKRYNEASPPEAYASAARGPEVVAKDLYRRVVGHPDSVAMAQRLLDHVATQQAQRESLLAHVATLEALGYHVHGYTRGEGVPAHECYQVQMYRDRGDVPIHSVRVTYSGHVTFDASTQVDRMADVLAALEVPTP